MNKLTINLNVYCSDIDQHDSVISLAERAFSKVTKHNNDLGGTILYLNTSLRITRKNTEENWLIWLDSTLEQICESGKVNIEAEIEGPEIIFEEKYYGLYARELKEWRVTENTTFSLELARDDLRSVGLEMSADTVDSLINHLTKRIEYRKDTFCVMSGYVD